ncbi:MAG: hypothetical protein ABI625_03170 [bacterium]
MARHNGDQRTVNVRHAQGELMASGRYEPLKAEGKYADNIFAFRRFTDAEEAIIVVPRLTRALGNEPIGAAWGDTHLAIGPQTSRRWNCALHGVERVPNEAGFRLQDILSGLPLAVLHGVG